MFIFATTMLTFHPQFSFQIRDLAELIKLKSNTFFFVKQNTNKVLK